MIEFLRSKIQQAKEAVANDYHVIRNQKIVSQSEQLRLSLAMSELASKYTRFVVYADDQKNQLTVYFFNTENCNADILNLFKSFGEIKPVSKKYLNLSEYASVYHVVSKFNNKISFTITGGEIYNTNLLAKGETVSEDDLNDCLGWTSVTCMLEYRTAPKTNNVVMSDHIRQRGRVSKLTEDQMDDIWKGYHLHRTRTSVLCKQYDVTPPTIMKIVNNEERSQRLIKQVDVTKPV